ncbi:helix-turn-helix domain-containing protein [Halobacillus sp. SY10]|uniref:Helix-turn-helix domain-containing protein n=1 Tax=Halobacillus aidingensis TaxID=240303 RepID=A0A1H0GB72_HALAD|nr:helix-turn-helix domain-containing protein [Halobacillus aidingensis]SDO04132.1 Helix-turn-helix domain-containing protein [Halobacillus aidingensis]
MDWNNIKEHQRFKDKKELDLHVRSFLYKRKAALSEGTLKVLTFIWRHAVKFPGVAFPKRATITKGTGLSESTVVRALRSLVNEKLIEKVTTKKPNGRQGGNLLVFLPQPDLFLPSDDTPRDTLPDTPQKTSTPQQDNPQAAKSTPETEKKQGESSISKVVPFDVTFLPSFIPSSFIETSQPFVGVEQVLPAWRTVQSAFKQWKLQQPIEHYLDKINETFRQAVFAYKKGMVRTELLRYFYGGLMEVFKQVVRKEGFESGKGLIFYDWLEGMHS